MASVQGGARDLHSLASPALLITPRLPTSASGLAQRAGFVHIFGQPSTVARG